MAVDQQPVMHFSTELGNHINSDILTDAQFEAEGGMEGRTKKQMQYQTFLIMLRTEVPLTYSKQPILTPIGAGGEDDTGRNPPTVGQATSGVGATVAPPGPNGNAG
jgi:hypothetical protein